MLIFILEAVFRSLLMAMVVWGAIRVFRVEAVLAQKVALTLLLAGVGIMPFVMHARWLTFDKALQIPLLRAAPSVAQQGPQIEPTTVIRSNNSPQVVLAQTSKSESTPSAALTSVGNHGDLLLASPGMIGDRQAVAHAINSSVNNDAALLMLERPSALSQPVTSSAWPWQRVASTARIVYLAGVALLLARTLLGLATAFRLWRRAQPLDGANIDAAGSIAVRTSRELTTPVTIGSTVLLPSDWITWDKAKLRIVLAHEQAHVRQADFYLQLLSTLYVAFTWFSPLGWWLQRKLSELGEALSDRAGIEQAPNAASYAHILLEFAAKPRPIVPFAGVAMARSSNLSKRIDRILNDHRFRLSFFGGRSHALVFAGVVPLALFAVIGLVRIVPVVEAAQAQSASDAGSQASGQASSTATSDGNTQVKQDVSVQEPSGSDAVVAPIPPPAPSAPVESQAAPRAPEPPAPAPEADTPQAPEPPAQPNKRHSDSYSYSNDDKESFAIVHGDDNKITMSGHSGKDLQKAREKVHGDFIWFEKDGKSYVITDPAILAQSQSLMRPNESLNHQQEALSGRMRDLSKRMAELNSNNKVHTEAMAHLQAQLGAKQGDINRQMSRFNRDIARMNFDSPEMKKDMAELNAEIAKAQLDTPEMKKEMAEMSAEIAKEQLDSPEMKKQMTELNARLAELQGDRFKKLTEDLSKKINAEALSDLQEKIGDIQGSIGDIQGTIGEEMGKFGEQQGKLGEQMGKLGEQMGRIGEQQGREAEDASRKVKSLIDKAYKEGKAKPVDAQ